MTFKVKLVCGHTVATDVNMTLQFPDDTHYVFCRACKDAGAAIAFQEVVSVNDVPNVPSGIKSVLPGDILRLQPKLRGKPERQRPFPYVTATGQYT